MNGFEYVAHILKQEGVKTMPCYPSNPLIEAVAKLEALHRQTPTTFRSSFCRVATRWTA